MPAESTFDIVSEFDRQELVCAGHWETRPVVVVAPVPAPPPPQSQARIDLRFPF